jgi:hypothetical protein
MIAATFLGWLAPTLLAFAVVFFPPWHKRR